MTKKLSIYGKRTTTWGLEALAASLMLLILVVGVVLWRLSSGPLDISFANKYIEQALHDPESGYSVTLEQSVLHWPKLNEPLYLTVTDLTLIKDDKDVVEIEEVALGLSSVALAMGRIAPVSIILNNPALNLVRTADNRIMLSFDDWYAEEPPLPRRVEDEYDEGPFMMALHALAAPEGAVDNKSPLAHLDLIEIRQARLVVEDHAIGVTWLLSPLDMAFVRDDEGLVVAADLQMPGSAADNPAAINAHIVYRRAEQDYLANFTFTDLDPHIVSGKIEELAFLEDQNMILDGGIELGFAQNLSLQQVLIDVTAQPGNLKLDGLYEQPFSFEAMRITARYDRNENIFDLAEASIDTGAVLLNISSEIRFTDQTIVAPVTIQIPILAQKDIAPLWPDMLRGDGAEDWLLHRLSKGTIDNIIASFEIRAEASGQDWSIDIRDILANFDVNHMDIDYRAPLAQVTNASGHGYFENDVLKITVEEAKLLDLDVSNGLVMLDNIIAGNGHADISLDVAGGLPTVFHYIAEEPLALSEDQIGINTASVKGDANLSLNIAFPTIRDLPEDELKVVVTGHINNVVLPDVVKDLDVTGGPFKVDIRGGKVMIGGDGKLEGRDVNFTWEQFFNPEGQDFSAQVKARMALDNVMRSRLGVNLEDWVEGVIYTQLTYTEYQDGRAVADIKGDLQNARLKIEPLDYIDPPNTAGTTSMRAVFRNGAIQEVSNLAIDSAIKIKGGHFKFRMINGESDLHTGTIPSFALRENKFAIDFEIGAHDLVTVSINGAFLDGRSFLKDDARKREEAQKPYDGPPVIAVVNVAQLRTRDKSTIRQAQLYVDLNHDGYLNQLEMDAIAGKGAIYLRMKPDDRGVQTLRLEADDAGAALRAFDMYENIRGGTLALYGAARNPSSNRVLTGKAQLNNFTVVDAPALARLVNAMSLSGLQQLLGSEGISFSRLESHFAWHIRRGGDLYVIKEGRTSGASIGLTFEGEIDNARNRIALEGTIVPVSQINNLVSEIPIIGTIITGGSGALIAATYAIKGPVKKPEVTVNPLAALTPGILRKILFEN